MHDRRAVQRAPRRNALPANEFALGQTELPGWKAMPDRGRMPPAAALQLMSPGQVLNLQQTAGNRATTSLIRNVSRLAVQREIETDYGKFKDVEYQPISGMRDGKKEDRSVHAP